MVTTTFETTQAVCAAMWPWLGERRRKAIIRVLKTDGSGSNRRSWEYDIREGVYKLQGRTECKNGHSYTKDNVLIGRRGQSGIHRRCKTCAYENYARAKERRKVQQKEVL